MTMVKTVHRTTPPEGPLWLWNDIVWLGSAPGLLKGSPCSFELIRRTCAQLIGGDIRFSSEQISVLNTKRHGPLGRYFEALVQSVIAGAPEVGRMHENLVVHDGSRTCGELDLLYELSGRWVHLELAVKFYICAGDRNDLFQWYGPAGRDTLGRKLARLFDHQLALPETEAGAAALAELRVGTVHSEALVMGMLFHPRGRWLEGNFVAPAIVAKDHATGWWLRRGETVALFENPKIMWRVLTKPEWLAPIDPARCQSAADRPLSGEGVFAHLDTLRPSYPVMIAAVEGGTEHHRGFIVPDDWPPFKFPA